MIRAELRNGIYRAYALNIPFQQSLGPTRTIEEFAAQVCMNQSIVVTQGSD